MIRRSYSYTGLSIDGVNSKVLYITSVMSVLFLVSFNWWRFCVKV